MYTVEAVVATKSLKIEEETINTKIEIIDFDPTMKCSNETFNYSQLKLSLHLMECYILLIHAFLKNKIRF